MKVIKDVQLPKLHNHYSVKVVEVATGEVVQEAYAENIVLDQIYHHLAGNSGCYGGVRMFHYGDGTGTIAASRTALFNERGYKELQDVQRVVTADLVTITGKITLGETEYNGNYLREIGVSIPRWSNDRCLISHAALEDSEGNPISIGPKTNTQIIELYATLYIQRSSEMVPFPNRFSNIFVATYGTLPAAIYNPSIKPQNLALTGGTYDSATKTWTSAKLRIDTGTGNDQGVMSFIENGLLTEKVSLQNPAIFPVYTFVERQIGAGDGTKKAFIFAPGLIKPNSEIIKVDGVTQTRDVDYKVYQGGLTTKKHDPSWRLPYGTVTPLVYNTNANKEILTLRGTQTGDDLPGEDNALVLIDYQELISLGRLVVTRPGAYATLTIQVYGSVDGITWEGPFNITYGGGGTSNVSEYTTQDPKLFRYLWLSANPAYMPPTAVALYGGANIVFTNPPSNGAIIRAQWDVDLPPKNNLLFYDAQVAYTASW